jgi:hypothetical protein
MDPWDPSECHTHQFHKWIHLPVKTYGYSYETFCGSFNPLLLLTLTQNDFRAMLQVKTKNKLAIQKARLLN